MMENLTMTMLERCWMSSKHGSSLDWDSSVAQRQHSTFDESANNNLNTQKSFFFNEQNNFSSDVDLNLKRMEMWFFRIKHVSVDRWNSNYRMVIGQKRKCREECREPEMWNFSTKFDSGEFNLTDPNIDFFRKIWNWLEQLRCSVTKTLYEFFVVLIHLKLKRWRFTYGMKNYESFFLRSC